MINEVYELAAALIGKRDEYEEGDITDIDIEESFYEKYEVSVDQFHEIADDLIKFTPSWESPLTHVRMQGFVREKEGIAITKREIK